MTIPKSKHESIEWALVNDPNTVSQAFWLKLIARILYEALK